MSLPPDTHTHFPLDLSLSLSNWSSHTSLARVVPSLCFLSRVAPRGSPVACFAGGYQLRFCPCVFFCVLLWVGEGPRRGHCTAAPEHVQLISVLRNDLTRRPNLKPEAHTNRQTATVAPLLLRAQSPPRHSLLNELHIKITITLKLSRSRHNCAGRSYDPRLSVASCEVGVGVPHFALPARTHTLRRGKSRAKFSRHQHPTSSFLLITYAQFCRRTWADSPNVTTPSHKCTGSAFQAQCSRPPRRNGYCSVMA